MTDATTPGLREYVRIIREQRVLIVAIVLIFAAVGLGISMQQDEKYRSEAKLIFQDPLTATDAIGTSLPSRVTPEQRSTIGAETVMRPETQAAVLQRLGRPIKAEVVSRPELRTGLVIIQASGSDPREAATVANAFADETRREAVREFRDEIDALIRQARREFRTLRGGSAIYRETNRVERQRRIAQLRLLRRLGEPVEIASRASVSRSPVSPKPVRNTIFGLVAGLTLGLLAAFARSALDRRLRTAADVADAAQLPLLGALRDDAMGQFITPAADADSTDLEGLRILRRNIELMDVDSTVSSVLVTSAVPEEGKSTVAAGVAVAAALAGKRTLLVECDLRRPVLAKRMGIEPEPGLTEYLRGSATPNDVVRSVALSPDPRRVNGDGPGPLAHLAVILAGHGVPQPAELLGSQRFRTFLEEVAQAYDLIVLDTPPLLPVADTLELLGAADAVALCARAGRIQRNQLDAARRALSTAGVAKAGLVVTGVDPSRDDDTYGSYSYAYSRAYAART